MGKLKVLQSALNGGELTHKLKGRPELPRYQSGLELCSGFVPFVLGGATVAPGSRLIASALPGGGNRLDVYRSLDDEGKFRGFGIETTPTQLRVFKGYAVADTIADLSLAQFQTKKTAQLDDYLYMVSATAKPIRVHRNTDSDWSLQAVPFVSIPFMRPPETKDITITPSALSGSITLTASADFFQAGHVGVQLRVNNGNVKITAVTDARHATGDVQDAIPAPQGVSSKTVTFTISYEPPMSGSPPVFDGEAFDVQCSATANYVDDSISSNNAVTAWPEGIVITSSSTTTQLGGTEPDKNWKEEAWSDLRGWPVGVAFFEQRMILAGSKTYPTTVWGSKSGEVLDFALGTEDSAAFALTLACADTPIRSIEASDAINVFTATKEIVISATGEKPLTPTNFSIKPRTYQGASEMAPVKSGSSIIFASVSKNRLYSIVYRLEENRYAATDLTIYGEHLVREFGGIEQVVAMREPHPILWCRTAAGTVITLTYDAEQQVSAWARQPTDGVVLDMVSVQDTDGNDQIWLVVQRNGQTNIEALDWTLQTHSAVSASDVDGKETWTGLEHLEGKTVAAVADGFAVTGLSVAAGAVTLPFVAKEVEIGLPFVARLKDLPLGVAGSGATISQQASVNEIKVLLHDTRGCSVNGERIPFQRFDSDLLDKPVPAFTGWKKVGALGWGNNGSGGQVEIVRDLPLPCTVLAIVKEVTVNG